MKAATLESKFPLLTVENGCIVSKDADITVAFRVFTVTSNLLLHYIPKDLFWYFCGE
ncbi:MAG: DUF3875 domain-containing protein [Dysgonamonadaceae bacterium]|nr:DUF3875 domain-containing protein [Dysgonamonadaceae bacterium]